MVCEGHFKSDKDLAFFGKRKQVGLKLDKTTTQIKGQFFLSLSLFTGIEKISL